MSKRSGGAQEGGGGIEDSHSPGHVRPHSQTHSAISQRIQQIISNLTNTNFRQALQEIEQIQNNEDSDLVETLLIKHLILAVDFHNPLEQSQIAPFQLLSQRITNLKTQPSFATIIRTALDDVQFLPDNFIPLFSHSLHLSQPFTIVVGLAMARSISALVKEQGKAFLHQIIPAHIQGHTLETFPDTVAAALVRFIREDLTFPKKAVVIRFFLKSYDRVLDAGREKRPAIVNIIEDAGFSCSNSAESLKKLIRGNISTPLSVSTVAEIVAMIVQSQDGSGIDRNGNSGAWKVKPIASALCDLMNGGSWDQVMENLDCPRFRVFNIDGFKLLLEIYREANGVLNSEFHTQILIKPWKTNPTGQWSLLKTWLSSPEELVSLPVSPELEILLRGIGETWSPTTANFVKPFLCLPLLDTLLELSQEKALVYSQVSELFQKGPFEHAPGSLLMALVKSSCNCPLRNQLIATLMSTILPVNNHPNSTAILQRVWKEDHELVSNAFLEVYNSDPSLLSRILDILLEVQDLRTILTTHPLSYFSVDLAALASLREALDLSRWIDDSINKHGTQFAEVLLSFTKDRLEKQRNTSTNENRPSQVVVTPESFQIFFDRLRGASSSLTLQQREEISRLVASAAEPVGFSPDIEEEANRSFQLIYSNKMSIEDAIKLLRRYKASTIAREQKIFQCMIRNLFDEYRFFPKYPDPELQITGIMFGSLVQNQLISYIPLGIALRYVLEALKSPSSSKMFMFGVIALEQFTPRLSEWPQYCLHLKQIPALKSNHKLYQLIESSLGVSPTSEETTPPGFDSNPSILSGSTESFGKLSVLSQLSGSESNSPPPQSNSVTLTSNPSSQDEEETMTGHTHNIRTLTNLPPRFVEPEENVKDSIQFIFNNVSAQNIDQKLRDLKKVLHPEYNDYLAHYVVVKRVSMADNFQELYLEFIERLNDKVLCKKVLEQTTRSIRALISSEKIRTEISERSLLKNLGNWLGLQTIAKDRPLRYLHLPLKNLMLEAYETGKLIAVIPLVSKILSKATTSKWFKLPSPWTSAIVKLLVEFYRVPQLKLPLKFEVEILAGLLGFQISEITPSELLKNLRPFNGVPLTDFEFVNAEPEVETDAPLPGSGTNANANSTTKYQLQFVHINPTIPLFNQKPNLKKSVYVAINRAIQDVIAPVVERSIVIASVTTRELVMKDFCMEPDENKMLRGAFNMVQSLAGSLAAVTSKESLRAAMINNLRAALSPDNPIPAHIDHAIHTLVQDNLELSCGIVQKSAAEACIRPTAEHLLKSVVDRKNHRERSSGTEKYYDINFVGSVAYNFTNTLPDFLRPKMGGVTPKQMQVYEEFTSSTTTSSGSPPPTTTVKEKIPSNAQSTLRHSVDSTSVPEQGTKLVDQYIVELSNAVSLLTNVRSLSEVPQNHPVLVILTRIGEVLGMTQNRVEAAVYMAQRAFIKLFDERGISLHREAFLSLLDAVAAIAPKIRTKLTEYLLYAAENQKFHREIVPALLHSKLVNVNEYDQHLAQLLAQHNREAVEFATFIVQNFLMKSNNIFSKNDFPHSLENLVKLGANLPPELQTTVSRQFVLPEKATNVSFDYQQSKLIGVAVEQNSVVLLEEWIKLQNSPNMEKVFPSYVQRLQQGGFYGAKRSPSMTELSFYRVCIEYAVQKTAPLENNEINDSSVQQLNYSVLDAVSKLFVVLIKYHMERSSLLSRILTVMVKVVEFNARKLGVEFDQRPFHRLILNLMMEFAQTDSSTEQQALPLLIEVASALHSLEPATIPAFAFSWLELISNRHLMPKLLKEAQCWFAMEELLVDLLRFLEPFLRKEDLSRPVDTLYQGCLRVLLVLLHDFPEFLCEYHFSFCDVIPTTAVQMRNLILSAFPRTMKLPDPFTPNLKVDLLPEIKEPPRIRTDFVHRLNFPQPALKGRLDAFLRTLEPQSFLSDLLFSIKLNSAQVGSQGTKYNVPLINALVLYIGARALSDNSASGEFSPQAPMDIFRYLAVNMDSVGRYILFNSIANQLRYPNNHTHYFSCVLLFLFAEATQEIIQEQVTRVLVERLIGHRPHPWGLLITFVELIKNPRYNFWSRNFTHIAPEIERLFFQVGNSITTHRNGGASEGGTAQ